MNGSALVSSAGLLAVLGIGGACSPVDAVKPYRELAAERSKEATSTWSMFPVEIDDVFRVVASGGGRAVEVQRTGGGLWEPGTGAAPAAGALMSAAETHVIPMHAYRRLDVDPSDPGFGFAGADLTLSVETHTARRMTIRFGGPNPTGGGYYVRRDDDPAVYVVVDQVLDEVRSILAGKEIVRAEDPRVEKVLADNASNEDPEEVTNPWLGQVIDGSH
jgi:hypothetical protein